MKVGFKMNKCSLQSSFSNNVIAIILIVFLFSASNINKNKTHPNTWELLVLLILIVLSYSNRCCCINGRNLEKHVKSTKNNRRPCKNKYPVQEDDCHENCNDESECGCLQSDLAEEVIFQ